MYKILKNIIEMDDYSVQKLSKSQPPEPFEWNTVEGTELNVSDCIGGKGKIEVKANTYQKQLSGKNLLNTLAEYSAGYSTTIEGITFTLNEDGTITANGTVTGDTIALFDYSRNASMESNGKKIIAQLISGTFTGRVASLIYDANWNNTISFDIPTNNSIGSRNLVNDVVYARLRLIAYPGAILNNAKFAIMVVDETETDLTYQKYVGGVPAPNPNYPQEIKVVTGNNVINHVGKNRIKVSAVVTSHAGLSNTLNDDNSVSISGTPTQVSSNTTVTKNQIIPAGTYTFSINKTVPFNVRLRLFFEDGTYNDYIIFKGNTSITFNSLLSAKSWRIWISGLSVGQEYNETLFFQLEEGSVATEYEPHQEKAYQLNLGNIELCKIGDYEDVLFKNVVGDENYNAELEEGGWYKKGVIDKIVLDGSENWGSVAAASGAVRFVCNSMFDTIIPESLSNVADILADKLVAVTANNTAVGINGIAVAGSGKFVIYYDSVKNYSPTQFREWLNDNNIVVYYAVATPTYEKITDPTLISQLEALNKAKWFKGVNHWWTEANNLDPVLKGTYRQAINE